MFSRHLAKCSENTGGKEEKKQKELNVTEIHLDSPRGCPWIQIQIQKELNVTKIHLTLDSLPLDNA